MSQSVIFGAGMRVLANSAATSHGVSSNIRHERYYPATIDDPVCARYAGAAAPSIGLAVDRSPVPAMAAEDISFMLREIPGAYVWLGQGEAESRNSSSPRHSKTYDFNDRLLPIGARYFAAPLEQRLAKSGNIAVV